MTGESYYPELENGVRHFKVEKEGRQVMSVAVERYANKKAKEAEKKGMKKGMEKGMKKGMEKGIEQGIERGVLIDAKKLLSKNLSADKVADLLDLNIEKVKSIEKEMLVAD